MKNRIIQSLSKGAFLTLLVLILTVPYCFASGFPERPITGIVPWGPGGATDTCARAFAPLFEKALGQPIVVQNKPGASGAVGTKYAIGKNSDGYTVLFSAETPAVFKVMGTSDVDFSDLEPITMLARQIPTVTVSADAPWKDINEFLDTAKKEKSGIKSAYAGPATTGHIASLLFNQATGIEIPGVPFGGGGKVMIALLGHQVDVTFNPLSSVIDNYKAGKVRILATFTKETVEGLDGVPAIGEIVPEFKDYLPWGPFYGLFVKKGTPEDVVNKLKEAADEVVKDQEWLEFVDTIYGQDSGLKGDDFQKFISNWQSRAAWLLFDTGAAKTDPTSLGIPRP